MNERKKARTYAPLTAPKRIVSWWLRFEDLNWPSADGLDKIKRRAEGKAELSVNGDMVHIRMPKNTAYAVLYFPVKRR